MTQREEFEAWAKPIIGDNPTWRESGDCELAWQAWQAAQAAQPSQAGASPVEPSQAGELSDEEILEIYDECNSCQYGTLKQRFARAIIAAINAKGPTT